MAERKEAIKMYGFIATQNEGLHSAHTQEGTPEEAIGDMQELARLTGEWAIGAFGRFVVACFAGEEPFAVYETNLTPAQILLVVVDRETISLALHIDDVDCESINYNPINDATINILSKMGVKNVMVVTTRMAEIGK